ncbi:sporulation protein YtxC [Brevibacillus ginsengisoli]|uniref:sporulation protein YtxC n=1 Tax=Brevibacillus ginsengisoli TaxID=363854 RepID=UPI003CFB82CC
MQTLSVLLQKDKPASRDHFRQIVAKTKQQVSTSPVTIEVREDRSAGYDMFTFVSWSAEEYTLETRDRVRSFVSLVVMEFIIEQLQPQLIRQIIRKAFSDQVSNDWSALLPYIHVVLQDNDREQSQLSYKTRLYQQILEYLQDHREIVMDGFVRFRCKPYLDTLQDAIEVGLKQYKEDKEYKEFVELLRYFVSVQETRYELVHVVQSGSKPFLFFDETGSLINLDQLDMILQSVGQDFREEDYVVSALITLAPKRILFHLADQRSNLIETLYGIFGDRLASCQNCSYCQNVQRALDFIKSTHYNT